MSPVVVVIGWILAVPSMLGCLSTIIMYIVALFSELGFGLGVVTFFASMWFIFYLVIGLVGYILIMKKNVFRCVQCGFTMDRA